MSQAQSPDADRSHSPPSERAVSTTITPGPDQAGPIQYAGPDTYILLDTQGRPQPMPGMTFEDFMAAWRQSHELDPPERQPRMTIEDVRISGRATGDRAELRYDVTVRLMADGAVEVPLGLSGAILRDQPQFRRAAAAGSNSGSDAGDSANSGAGSGADSRRIPGDGFCNFDPQHGGYVAHLSGRSGESYTVSLDLLVPLARDGVETALSLNCPRALAARMTLDVDGAATDASVSSGAIVSRETLPDGRARLNVVGQAGDFRLAWNSSDQPAEFSTVLSATGAIQVSIDGRSVRTDARLAVRSYGGGFDRFRVRLPRGAKLIQDRPVGEDKDPGFRIRVEDQRGRGDGRPQAATDGEIVLVELPEMQKGPVVVTLSTEQPLELVDGRGDELAAELSGFDVLGAVRQFGDVALLVADDWQLRSDVGQYVRQVDPSELDGSLQQTGVTAAFQYDRQPWSLGVRVAARQFRIQATPDYVLECLSDEARLRVHLTYQVLGARAFRFRVDLKGWEMAADPLESGGLVDRERLVLTGDGQLELPLAQPTSRRVEITFFVRRALPRDTRRLSLPLPVPEAESIGTGDLTVVAARGIELVPDAARSKGLTPLPVIDAPDAPAFDEPTGVRYRCFQPGALFVAERVSRARDVSLAIATQVELLDRQAEVRERVQYSVRFVPISELVFEVPGDLPLEDAATEIALLPSDGDISGDVPPETLLMFTSDADEGNAAVNSPARHVRVSLPQPRLGRFAVEWRFNVKRPENVPPAERWGVPLAMPVDGRLTESTAVVGTPRDLAVELDLAAGSAWKVASPESRSAPTVSANTFVADRAESTLPLAVRVVDPYAPSTTTVERAWLQTWIGGNMRQERAAFRFRTSGEFVMVELPPDSANEEMEVLVDRGRAEVVSRGGGRMAVRVPLPSDGGASPMSSTGVHTLELRYRRASYDRVLTRRRLTPPQIVGRTALAEVYWHIVLPADRHVIQSPPQLTSASEWQWLGAFWGRRPLRTQSELEDWVGASSQLVPTAAQNEYLFSGLAPIASIEVVTAPRWLVVLAASGTVLAAALIGIYLPSTRRRGAMAVGAVLLALLAIAYPTPALLIAQASVLGVILAALAALIARLGARQTQWYLPSPGGSTQRQITPRGESVVMPSLASATSGSTPTAPTRLPEFER